MNKRKTFGLLLACAVIGVQGVRASAFAELPNFLNKGELAQWRATHTPATTAPASLQTATYGQPLFFTGKPYDADSGTYVFKYRNYNPELARWTTPDPSGFPDGANNCRYAPVPTAQIDPTGLAVNPTFTFANNTTNVGVFNGTLGFNVSSPPYFSLQLANGINTAMLPTTWQVPATATGWIVQQITASSSVVGACPTSPYYEVWSVNNNGAIQPQNSDVFLVTLNPRTPQQGNFTETGVAKFFPDNTPGVAATISTWSTTAIPMSGVLPATFNQPTWWSLGLGSITKTLQVSWE